MLHNSKKENGHSKDEKNKPRDALEYIRTQIAALDVIRKVRRKPKFLKLRNDFSLSGSLNRHGYHSPQQIGEGGCAFVYKVSKCDTDPQSSTGCDDKDSRPDAVVAKVSKRSISNQCSQERISWMSEADILSAINHVNVIRCLEFFHVGGHGVMILEYVDGGDVYDVISQSDSVSVNARSIICQILEGLDYLHGNKRIAHMDLKVENILLNQKGLVNICDFGSAVRVPECGKIRTLGITTPSILPPEYIQCDFCDPMACDVWSVGIIIYLFLAQRYPYGNGELAAIDLSVYRQSLDFSDVDTIEFESMINLTRCCLEKIPKKRLTVKQALQSPFFKL
ncbi:hypothetical protein SNE40_017722 [Patella caerulea]|uniref:Protein kinase domain-containing protein n=1 Tax=Patella caerulea TaxID=87958 RepID=A0AAN8PMF4_PATCE